MRPTSTSDRDAASSRQRELVIGTEILRGDLLIRLLVGELVLPAQPPALHEVAPVVAGALVSHHSPQSLANPGV